MEQKSSDSSDVKITDITKALKKEIDRVDLLYRVAKIMAKGQILEINLNVIEGSVTVRSLEESGTKTFFLFE